MLVADGSRQKYAEALPREVDCGKLVHARLQPFDELVGICRVGLFDDNARLTRKMDRRVV